ncbi:MAG: hypothetical protein V4704_10155 [Pseudomonadota bacterium]
MIRYTLDASAAPELAAIERALSTLDTSALLDRDASGSTIRISTLATQDELLACLHAAGATDPSQHLVQLPSECCGGCGG